MRKSKKSKGFLGKLLVLLLPFFWFVSTSAAVFVSTFFILSQENLGKNIHWPTGRTFPYSLFGALPPVLGASSFNLGLKESRPVILEQFFSRYRSPLVAYGDLMIRTADRYNIPWTLLPAIAGQESTFCRPNAYPENSYNCWGWGIHTRYTKMFSSYEEGIEKVTKGLSEYYRTLNIDRSWPIERQVLSIKTLYNKTSLSWDRGVLYFISELENFSTP